MPLTSKLADVGGLSKHIKSVKESMVLPLLYPKFCADYNISTSRGILFHGPPGTGKTLLARALAHECSDESNPIAFFHFNSADILSKWVGEGEARICEIFEAARVWQPSLVFFDEIDGLAPSRIDNDRPGASLVSTLLAALDGFSKLGRVLVVGSTNRLDAIDSALRRPGRFDQELLFSLPSEAARMDILKINTRNWDQSEPSLQRVAKLTNGFCGADLSLLCSKAAKHTFNRVYPGALDSSTPLPIDFDEMEVEDVDFVTSQKKIKPAAQTLLNFDLQPIASPFSELLSSFASDVASSINVTSKGCFGQSYMLPNVVVLEGLYPIAAHRVLSAALHALDNQKITLVDHASLATSDDLSGCKELSRILNSEVSTVQPELFVISDAPTFFSQNPALLSVFRSALSRPVTRGGRSFLFTCSRTDDIRDLFDEVDAKIIKAHIASSSSIKAFFTTSLDLFTRNWECSPIKQRECLVHLNEASTGWPVDHIIQLFFQLNLEKLSNYTELEAHIRDVLKDFVVPELDDTVFVEL
ncbi:TAT-binding protein-like protein 7, AAA ATPase [Entomophthora muscae]|uniref:TAT-binding protein-like protein 7, AAA ATPase n=1 Tax=Entomophthora muscae TaxID=34485 RepID=A0ACC2ST39_9FUNG|nr:TAT-binding protein-like protein 7, AAA ATPase [Entomophthora muscae]